MPTKPVTLRLPEELLEAIDKMVASTNTNRTDVVVKALQQVFSGEAAQPTPTTTTATTATAATTPDTTLLKRLEDLEVKISSVMDRLDSDVLSRLTKRVSVLEEGLSSSEPPTPVETPSTTKTTTKGQKRTPTVKETKTSKVSKEPAEPPASKEPPEPPASKEPAEPPASKQSKTKAATKTPNGRRRQAKAEKKLPAAKEASKTKTIDSPPPAEEPTPTKRKTRAKATPEVTTPAATKNQRGTIEWLTVKQAFEKLGGDASDPESVISSIDGARTVKLNRFGVLSASDYKTFGLEFRPDRRSRRLPCLRKL
ncbi:ribbon-helix-helix domain-containing protein [Laspinema olomoucense]|uniref:Ribbon-helix-helix protein, CopG family n=1 Tax=Laspinema olomoucense D3b TaxID=2953688 RepID=A0ABT2N199_9CYAN|nr:ribbon-helix-helix protein, CopG family [Laspinema sp. D3b]MCT7976453.1 ribbon-helix-helix protein, CopG family [Laspinema sp. D3b]